MKIGISACLLGQKVRYDGKEKRNDTLMHLLSGHDLFPVCPEVAGGLPVPRHPSEQREDRVINDHGRDVTEEYRTGSEKCLQTCLAQSVCCVILKARSPACGKDRIYDGSFTHTLKEGSGTFARMCLQNHIPVFTEEETEEILRFLKEET